MVSPINQILSGAHSKRHGPLPMCMQRRWARSDGDWGWDWPLRMPIALPGAPVPVTPKKVPAAFSPCPRPPEVYTAAGPAWATSSLCRRGALVLVSLLPAPRRIGLHPHFRAGPPNDVQAPEQRQGPPTWLAKAARRLWSCANSSKSCAHHFINSPSLFPVCFTRLFFPAMIGPWAFQPQPATS
jgi:hypothetical protein